MGYRKDKFSQIHQLMIIHLFLFLFCLRYALFLSRWYVIFVLIGVPLVFIGLGVYSVVLNVPDFTNPTKVRYSMEFFSQGVKG